MECPLRFPLLGITDLPLQNVLLGDPATGAPGIWARKILNRMQQFDYLCAMLRGWKDSDNRKDHTQTRAKNVPAFPAPCLGIAKYPAPAAYICSRFADSARPDRITGRQVNPRSAYRLRAVLFQPQHAGQCSGNHQVPQMLASIPSFWRRCGIPSFCIRE
jgi:hypothetical protein